MNALQFFFTRLLPNVSLIPQSWAKSMEQESREWMIQCPCGYEKSIWDAGGIRWKSAARNKLTYGKCSQCGKWHWMKVYKRDAQPTNAAKLAKPRSD